MTIKGAGDNAFTARTPYGLRDEATYAGALSFLRRPYARDVANADIAVTGIPFACMLVPRRRPGMIAGVSAAASDAADATNSHAMEATRR